MIKGPVIKYGEGGCKKGGAGSQFLPLQKKGGRGGVLAMTNVEGRQ